MRIRLFALVCAIAAGTLACPTSPQDGILLTRGMDSLALQNLSEEQVSLLRATLEVDGLAGGESTLDIVETDTGGLAVSGHFELSVDKKIDAVMVMRLYGRLHAEADEVLLARLEQTLVIEPHQANSPAEAGVWQSDGEPIFDLNRNRASNLDDLKGSIDPAPPAPYFGAVPTTLEFFSGIRLGNFERRIVLVQNSSTDTLEIRARLFDAPGVLLSRFDQSGSAVDRIAKRELADDDKLVLPAYSETFIGVSFAPMNAYLTTGVIQFTASNTRTHVLQTSQVKLLANTGGDLQPADPSYRPAAIATTGEALGGLDGSRVQFFPEISLFSGSSVASADIPGQDEGLVITDKRLSWGEEDEFVAADAVFLIEIPAEHRFAATLGKISSDVDLSLFALAADDSLDKSATPAFSQHVGTSPEAVELRNDSGQPLRALLVLGRHETQEIKTERNALTETGAGVPYSLSGHLISGPEFDEIEPVSRDSGPLEGGVPIVLRGRGFKAGDGEIPSLRVTFADSIALDVRVNASGTEIHCTLPPGSLEVGKNPATIVVLNASSADGGDGQAATLPEFFTYFPPAPVITELMPSIGPVVGGTLVTINGGFFSRRFGGPIVRWGGVDYVAATDAANHFLSATASEIVLRAPAHEAGLVNVAIYNKVGSADTDRISGGSTVFRYQASVDPAPLLTSVDLDQGGDEGGERVDLWGQNFKPGASVLFDNTAASSVTFVGATHLQARVPAHAAGRVGVTVVNADGQQHTLTDAYLYVTYAPSISRVLPDRALVGGGDTVAVYGRYFGQGVAVTLSLSGSVTSASQVVRVSSGQLLVTLPALATPGDYDFNVINPDGQSDTLRPFVILTPSGAAPSIRSITPASGPLDVPTTVTIGGSDFTQGLDVLVGALPGQDVQVNSAGDQLSFTTPPGQAAGAVVVRVVNPDGQSATGIFTYLGRRPVIYAVSPQRGPISGGTFVSVSGSNFDVEGLKLLLGGEELPLASRSGSRVEFVTPASALAQTVSVQIVNPDGQSAQALFAYYEPQAYAPRIDSITPDRGLTGVRNNAIIYGAHFDLAAQVWFGTMQLAPGDISNLASGTELHVAVPQVTRAGQVVVRVINEDGQDDTTSYTFVEPVGQPPRIDQINPTRAPVAGGVPVTLDGINLAGVEVRVDGTAVSVSDVVSSSATQVVFNLPAAAQAGSVLIQVVDPLGQADGAPFFYYPRRVERLEPLLIHAESLGETLIASGPDLDTAQISTVQFVDSGQVVFAASISGRGAGWLRVTTAARLAHGAYTLRLIYSDGDGVDSDATVLAQAPQNATLIPFGDKFTAFGDAPLMVLGDWLNPDHLSDLVFTSASTSNVHSAPIFSKSEGSIVAAQPADVIPGLYDVELVYDSGYRHPLGTQQVLVPEITSVRPSDVPAQADLSQTPDPSLELCGRNLGPLLAGAGPLRVDLEMNALVYSVSGFSAVSTDCISASLGGVTLPEGAYLVHIFAAGFDFYADQQLHAALPEIRAAMPNRVRQGQDQMFVVGLGFNSSQALGEDMVAQGSSGAIVHLSTIWIDDSNAQVDTTALPIGNYEICILRNAADCSTRPSASFEVVPMDGGPGTGGPYDCLRGPSCAPGYSCEAGPMGSICALVSTVSCDPEIAGVMACTGNSCRVDPPGAVDSWMVQVFCDPSAAPCSSAEESLLGCGAPQICVHGSAGNPFCVDECDNQRPCSPDKTCVGMPGHAICVSSSLSLCPPGTYGLPNSADRCFPETDCSLTGSDGFPCGDGKRCQAGACVDIGTLQLVDTGPEFPMTLGSTELRAFALELSNSTNGSAPLDVSSVQVASVYPPVDGRFYMQNFWLPQTLTAGSSTPVHLQAQAGVSSIDDYLLIVDSDDPSHPRRGYLLSATVAGGGPGGGACDPSQPINIDSINTVLHAEGMPQTLTLTGSGFCPGDSVYFSTTASSVDQVTVVSPWQMQITVTADCYSANQTLDLNVERADQSSSALASIFVKPARIIISEVVLNPAKVYSCEAPPLGWGSSSFCQPPVTTADAYVAIGNPSTCSPDLAAVRDLYLHIVEPTGAVSGSPMSIRSPNPWSFNSDTMGGCTLSNFGPGCTAAISGFAPTAALSPLSRFELYEKLGSNYDLLDAVGLGSGAVPDGSQLFGLDAVRREIKGSLDDPPVWRRDKGNALAMLAVGPPPAAWVSDVLVSSGVTGGDLAGGVDASDGPGVVYLPAAAGSPYFVDGSLAPVQVSPSTARDLDLATYYQTGVTAWTITWQSATGDVFLSDGVGGTSWNTAIGLGLVTGRALPRVAVKPASSDALVAYASGTELHLWSNLWTPARGLTGNAFVNTSSVALDVCYSPTNDEAHVVWGGNDGSGAVGTYHTVVVASAGTPSVGSPVTILNVDPVELRAAVDASRTIWVAARDAFSQLTVLRMDTVPNMQTWPFYDVGLFDIEVDSLGTPVLVYQDTANGGLWLARYNGSTWDMPEKIVPDVTSAADLDLVLDSMDQPHVFWDQGFPEVLMHTHQ